MKVRKIVIFIVFLYLFTFFKVNAVGLCTYSSCEVISDPNGGQLVYTSSEVNFGEFIFDDNASYAKLNIPNICHIKSPGAVNEGGLFKVQNVDDNILISCTMPSSDENDVSLSFSTTVYDDADNVINSSNSTFNMVLINKNVSYNKSIKIDNVIVNGGIDKNNFKDSFIGYFEANSSNMTITLDTKGSIGKSDDKTIINGNTITINNIPYGESEYSVVISSEYWSKYLEPKYNRASGTICLDDGCFGLISGNSTMALFTINRPDNRSNNSLIKSLKISDVNISFNKNLKNYTADVDGKISKVTISSTLEDSKASYVNGFGNRTVNLKDGENTILIKVKAENGSESVYTVVINKAKSSDSSLKILKVNDKEIKLTDLLSYKVFVENNILLATILAEATSESATIEYPNSVDLKEGSNIVEINVTSASGTKKTYELNIFRDGKINSNALLESLCIKGYKIDFSPYRKEYHVKISKEDKLDISYKTQSTKSKVLVAGNKDLKKGSVIKVKVIAESSDEEVYKIIIDKDNNFSIFIIIGLLILVVVFVIIFVIVKNKHSNSNNKNGINDVKTKSVVNNSQYKPISSSESILKSDFNVNDGNSTNDYNIVGD